MTNRISAYGLVPHLGGTGLGPEERLIRVISHGPSVIDLLNGHLNVTRTGLFVTRMDNEARYDTREAAETTVDCERHAMFFGSLADYAASKQVGPIILSNRKPVLSPQPCDRWAEARGLETGIIERPFAADFRGATREPPVALIGVDNALAWRHAENVEFERVIEASCAP